MAQHDYSIANQTGAAFRGDINNALAAIVSQNSGATEPDTKFAYQIWADTTSGKLKIRNAANTAWITRGSLTGEVETPAGTVSAPGVAVGGSNHGFYYSSGAVCLAVSGVQVAAFSATGQAAFTAAGVGIGAIFTGTNIAGATTNIGVSASIAFGSTATVRGVGMQSSISTEAGGAGLATAAQWRAFQGTFNTGVTNQHGFWADASLIGAASNHGFRGDIPAGTVRTVTNVVRSSNVVTITTSAAHGYTVGQSVSVAATTNTGVNGTFVITAVPSTTTFQYAQTGADIASVADTGSTLVVGRWNIRAEGTAPNYFAGSVIANAGFHQTPTRSTVASGSTIVLTTATNHLLYDNAATTAALTVTLPSIFLTDGQVITLCTRSEITALTINGGTIYGAPATLAAGGYCSFIYSSAAAAWFRKG